MPNEDDISKLLRLKRYEQPPPGYFEDFLSEFQYRQRAELLRRPVWQIFFDRVLSLAPNFQVPRLAYAAIVALALVSSAGILMKPSTESPRLAEASAPVSLSSPQSLTIGSPLPVALTSTGSPSVHYVLPTRPVSYASSRGF